MQRKQFVTTEKQALRHGTIKFAILDLPVFFRMHLQSNPDLESSGQASLILHRQLRGYKYLYPKMKHHKCIPAKLVLHIYKQTNNYMKTSIDQLIEGAFFFGMQSCEYHTTPKGESKCTRILQKGDIPFYRKIREITHDRGILHISNEVPLKLRTEKNGVKDATSTQWRTTTTLCLVRIWAEIIIRLESHPVTTHDTTMDTVWVDHLKTATTSQMTTKSLIYVTLSFGKYRLGISHKDIRTNSL